MARDDFSQSVINKLRNRVAHRCSNPICRVPTSAPAENDKVNSIGVAAHICAAASGGPRYDSSMTSEQRKSIDNAIWLCGSCSMKIDRDTNLYTVRDLKDWKAQAEASALLELGQKLPSPTDATDTLTTALTGLPKRYIASAISNVHKAASSTLESLDPRFHISTGYSNEVTTYEIHAKETVPITIKLNQQIAQNFLSKHVQLIQHGKDLEIDSTMITFEGSKLFEELINNNKGIIKISSRKTKATQKMWLLKTKTNEIELIDDLKGEISLGNKSFTFNGSTYNKILNIKYQKSFKTTHMTLNFSISLDFNKWDGCLINQLSYFEKIFSIFQKLNDNWLLYTSLATERGNILKSSATKTSDWTKIQEITSLLYYTKRCQIIANFMHIAVIFHKNVSYSADEHKFIANLADIIEEKEIIYEVNEHLIIDLIVDDKNNNIKIISEITEPQIITISIENKEEIYLFGTCVKLPPKTITLESVLPKIHISDLNTLKNGDHVEVEWIPQNNFKFYISYEKTNQI